MNQDEFVEIVHQRCLESANESVIAQLDKPLGRFPSKKRIENSKWWNGLDPDDKSQIAEQMRHTAHSALFDLFSIIDGVQTLTDPGEEKIEFKLEVIQGGKKTIIGGNGAEMYLHANLNAIFEFWPIRWSCQF